MKTHTSKNESGLAGVDLSRRSFLRYAGAGAAAVAAVATIESCKKEKHVYKTDVGSGDTAILNYAYALEQLEAAFYIQVCNSPYSGMTSAENALLSDIRDHEIAHREFFKAALGSSAIKGLTPNFSSINFSDRSSVLAASKAFEDLGVSAYNGAGAMLKNPDYLVIAGKIVSVEARHAALIRDLIQFNTFIDASVVDINNTSTEYSKTPAQVIPVANQYLAANSQLSFTADGIM
jgi:rubrerythrin